MSGNHSTAIANFFLELAAAKGLHLTQMQLQKLVYIAHGWSLAILSKPLTSDAPCAWDYGPVYPDLWEALRRYGKAPVSDKIRISDYGFGDFSKDASAFSTANLTGDQSELISQVFENYGKFHAFQLSAMTHEKGTPWYKVFVEDGVKRGEISSLSIREHFIDIAKKRAAA